MSKILPQNTKKDKPSTLFDNNPKAYHTLIKVNIFAKRLHELTSHSAIAEICGTSKNNITQSAIVMRKKLKEEGLL